jgi:hypothetical protein
MCIARKIMALTSRLQRTGKKYDIENRVTNEVKHIQSTSEIPLSTQVHHNLYYIKPDQKEYWILHKHITTLSYFRSPRSRQPRSSRLDLSQLRKWV